MESRGLKKNLGYQTLYQLLTTALPLITSPYLARVLGAEQLGVFSYTQSIANFFVLFGALGVVNYGTRTIASCKNDKSALSMNFFEIYAFQIIASFIALIIYGVYLLLCCNENRTVALLQGLMIWGTLLDINWVFFGVEDFKVTVNRNIVIKIITVVLVFLLVRSTEDLWLYTLIMAGGTVVSNAVLFHFLRKVVDFGVIKSTSFQGILKHIRPNLVLFVPLLAMSVYHIMDKTMLGALSSFEQTGFYYNADKIINIPVGIIAGVGTVMLPRMTAMIESGKADESNQLFDLSLEIIIAVSVAIAFGIAAVSQEFVPFFFGQGYDDCVMLIIVLSPVLIVKAMSQTSRMQFLIPNHKEQIFIESVFTGALINMIANWCLIPKMGALGAVIGTLLAELITCFWQYFRMSKYMNCTVTIARSSVYIGFGIVMFLIVRLLANSISGIISSSLFLLTLEIAAGSIMYLGCCVAFWLISKNPIVGLLTRKQIKH